jgi:hypothetical protein
MFTAVAMGSGARDYIPFGPDFATEDAAWAWLHTPDCHPVPRHVMIDVVPIEEAHEYLRDLNSDGNIDPWDVW